MMTNDQIKSGEELDRRFTIKDSTFTDVRVVVGNHVYFWQDDAVGGNTAQLNLTPGGAAKLAQELLSRTPSHGRVSGDCIIGGECGANDILDSVMEALDRAGAPKRSPDGGVTYGVYDRIALLSTPPENGEATLSKTETVAAPIPVEGEALAFTHEDERLAAFIMATRSLSLEEAATKIAAHRRAFSGGVDEKVRIVAWLRERQEIHRSEWGVSIDIATRDIADAIERGDHLSTIEEPRA